MDEQQQYADFLNDIKEALLDENVNQTTDDVNKLIEQNQSIKKAKLDAQRARDHELVMITAQRRRELEHDKKQLREECEQLVRDREEFEQKRKLLDQEQQQYFSAFLEEQLDNPVRVGNKIIVERDSNELDLERDHLIEQFKQLENERSQLNRDREKLDEQLQKHKQERSRLLNEQSDFVEHGIMDRDTLDTHVKQLVHVCEQLRSYDSRLDILPRKVFKTIPGPFREQIIKAYDMVLTALENVEQMSVTNAYKLIEKINKQTVARPEVQQTTEYSDDKLIENTFDYKAYKKRLKQYHEQVAERHIAEMMERPEDESLLESYEPSSANQNFFAQLQLAKEAETEEDGGTDPQLLNSGLFNYDTSEYMSDTVSEERFNTTQEDSIDPHTTNQPVTSTGTQPVTSTGTQPVTSTGTIDESGLPAPKHSTFDYIRGMFYKQPDPKGKPAGRLLEQPEPTYPDDPFVPPGYFDVVTPEKDPNVLQTASVYYNMRNKQPISEGTNGGGEDPCDPYDPYSECIQNSECPPWMPVKRWDPIKKQYYCTKAI